MPLELVNKDAIDVQRVQRAIDLAVVAHAGQLDKGGEPYLWHVLRVGINLLPDVDAAILGILHDVREDSDTTEKEIQAVLGEHHQHLYPFLGTLTHHPNDPYLFYVRDCARYPLTRKVKKADVRDNLSPVRLALAEKNGADRYRLLGKYVPALAILEDAESVPAPIDAIVKEFLNQ